jgi:aminoglycoside phosphotransferase (APT) family kinase protein
MQKEALSMHEEIQYFLPLYMRTFPWRAYVRITTCTNISTGWEGDLFCLALAYEEEGEQRTEEVILKLYHGQDGTRKGRSEFYSLQSLARIGYPVPRVLFAALEDSPFGRAGVVMEKIKGRTAAHLFEQSSPEQQQALLTQCCQLYIDLHALDWTAFVPDPARLRTKDVLRSWLAWARRMSDRWLPGVLDPILVWLQERCTEVASAGQQVSLLHGDFHLENLIVRDDGTLFVIDWTGTNISDYRFDLAWTLLLQRTQGAGELAEALLSEYERLVGHRIEHLAFFEVIACFKRLFEIIVSLKSGAVSLGLKPDAEGEMKQQIDRIQAVYTQLLERLTHPLPEVEAFIATLRDQADWQSSAIHRV